MKAVSIIIPTYNESENIPFLIERIDQVLSLNSILYEIIIIDDHSSDNTPHLVKKFSAIYPVKFYLKKGLRGKAYSLLQGFSHAKYSLIAMIDGDLQYPPEALPEMIEKINDGADVVVANRKEEHTSWIRYAASRIFMRVFAEWLHGLHFDVQSGLKLFKRKILKDIILNPSQWTFDLEFLLSVRELGHQIDAVDITYHPRTAGKSKVKLVTASLEIALHAVKMKFSSDHIINRAHTQSTKKKGFHYKGKKYVPYSNLALNESAVYGLFGKQKRLFILVLLYILYAAAVNWHVTLVAVISLITVIYFIDITYNLVLIIRSMHLKPELKVTTPSLALTNDSKLPIYTILCPLYKEWQVVPQFIQAIQRLDYPKNKLQVLLVLEADDHQTISEVHKIRLPKYVKPIIVPHSIPKTKPKACNYALQKVQGEYCVIYDAEDIPEADQLKKVVHAFKKVSHEVVCIQAKLDFYNPHQNLLTKLFTAEYALWFDLTLPGLQSLAAPIPLGGTSNHFKTIALQQLQGWDAFNVTEDCDLGVRLAKHGYKTAIVDSVTHEEANSDIMNWFWQRTRWIKGYLQTFLVHSRSPKTFIGDQSLSSFFSFLITVGGKIFSLYINPLMWAMTASYFLLHSATGSFIESLFPPIIFYMAAVSLVVGNFLYLYYYMIAAAKKGYFELVKYGFLIPFYWLFMSSAAWVALYKLVTSPYQWSKTKHGLHLNKASLESDFISGIKLQPSYVEQP